MSSLGGRFPGLLSGTPLLTSTAEACRHACNLRSNLRFIHALLQAGAQLLRALAALWAVPEDAVQQYVALHKPAVQAGAADLAVGRATLPLMDAAAGRQALAVAAGGDGKVGRARIDAPLAASRGAAWLTSPFQPDPLPDATVDAGGLAVCTHGSCPAQHGASGGGCVAGRAGPAGGRDGHGQDDASAADCQAGTRSWVGCGFGLWAVLFCCWSGGISWLLQAQQAVFASLRVTHTNPS